MERFCEAKDVTISAVSFLILQRIHQLLIYKSLIFIHNHIF